jgi:steroid delta-isomerase-like uncharacterized protein
MERQAMKELVTSFVDQFWNKGNFEGAGQLMTEDFAVRAPMDSLEGLKALASEFRTGFPDWHSTVEEMVVDGDTVVERWTGRGTHRGSFFGSPATGRSVEIPGVVFYRIRDGKIAEFRGYPDQLSLLKQIGAIQDPVHS